MNRIVHFEIHAQDMDRMQKFYQDVFGWEFQVMGEEYGHYRVIVTGTAEDNKRMEGIGINGGMAPRKGGLPVDGAPVNSFVSIIGVTNIDETIAKLEQAGATVALAKMDMQGVGLLAYYKDPEGNIFGIIQPVMPEQK